MRGCRFGFLRDWGTFAAWSVISVVAPLLFRLGPVDAAAESLLPLVPASLPASLPASVATAAAAAPRPLPPPPAAAAAQPPRVGGLVAGEQFPELSLRGEPTNGDPAEFSVTAADVSPVVYRILGDAPEAYLGFSPRVKIVTHPVPNAYARLPHDVFITSGLLASLRSVEELSFVLAHEIGHLVAHDGAKQLSVLPALGIDGADLRSELTADAFAVQLLARAGLKAEAALSLFTRLDETGRKPSLLHASIAHPTLARRVEALRQMLRSPAHKY